MLANRGCRSKLFSYKLFFILNCFLAILIGLRYVSYAPSPGSLSSWSFLLLSLIGHMSLLALGMGVILSPLLCIKNKLLRHSLISLIVSFAIYLLVVDTVVFSHYRLHIDPMLASMVMSTQVYSFSFYTWLTAGAIFSVIFIFEILFILLIQKYQESSFLKRVKLRYYVYFIVIALLGANILNIWAVAIGDQTIGATRRVFPLYYPLRANKFLLKTGLVEKQVIDRASSLSFNDEGDLNYPRKSLSFDGEIKQKNILLIAIDSWRFDECSKETTPNIWKFIQKNNAQTFTNHMSTGNCTRTGVFGLFYGLPGTYWKSFLSAQKEPILVKRLRELDYDFHTFPSAELTNPEFHRTIFSKMEDIEIRTEGKSASERDINLTKNWLEWFEKKRTEKPFFSFLFYDSPHAYNYPKDYPHVFEPHTDAVNHLMLSNSTDPLEYKNLYKTCVHFSDQQVGLILDALEKSGALEDTVVIITGDHGEEFNDNQLNFWGHNGNFSSYQVQVPFIVYDSSLKERNPWTNSDVMTSHQDLSPSLLSHYLGCSSPVNDYSTGLNIFNNEVINRDWILSSAYAEYALIEKERILQVSRFGTYELLDKGNKPIKNESVNFEMVKKAMEEMNRFYR